MKNLMIVLMFAPLMMAASTPDFSVIAKALNNGDVATLMKYFEDNVEITILDDEGVYSKGQAGMIIKKFFDDNTPKSFKLIHQGSNNNNLHYCIGDMITSTGKYRVCYYLKEINGKFHIQELGIEEE